MQTNYIDIKMINYDIDSDPKQFVDECEKKYRDQLKAICDDILSREVSVKVILIGGPSCSGKTTSARLLGEVLKDQGKKVISIEMDNFFISRNLRPILPNGSVDYDSINIVDLDLIKKCFTELFETGKSKFPIYDFIDGVSVHDKKLVKADPDTIIIFEGIHTLNPKLIRKLGTSDIYKIFICNNDGYKYGDIKIEPRQFRMVRRMVRDVQFRAVRIANTYKHWKDVTDAEDLYILPYSNKVDAKINTSHAYEINLYKTDIDEAIHNNEISYDQIPWFRVFEEIKALNKTFLPKTTLMKEFVNFEN